MLGQALNYDSVGVFGCPVENLTPHIDSLAESGMRFTQVYSAVSLCVPVRATMHTGLYPHQNGAVGFYPIHRECITLNERLHDSGYFIGMVGGKHSNYAPYDKYCVDFTRKHIGRHPSLLQTAVRSFFDAAEKKNTPFFLQVNCDDPHRPFIGAKGPGDWAGGEKPSRFIASEEIAAVPGFLENLSGVRKELAQYYTSVRRLDDCVGRVLDALDEAGLAEKTVVVFYGGDHGMAFPFAKGNNYVDSLHGGLIVRWPGITAAGSGDDQHFISTVDFTPTILDAAGCPPIPNIDGRSFLNTLFGSPLEGDWQHVFTFYNQMFAKIWYPMRGVITRDYVYVWNAWAAEQRQYSSVDGINPGDLAWASMRGAAASDSNIAERVRFLLHRTPDEFYVLKEDPYERDSRIHDPSCQLEITRLKSLLLAEMQRTGDPLAEAFEKQGDSEALKRGMDDSDRLIEDVPHLYPPFNQ